MIFQMHLEKQSYDKAVDEIKNAFNLVRIQLQKIQEAMGKIRRNALNYSVKDYEEILLENLETISDTKQKFQNYREMVKSRAKELEEENINFDFPHFLTVFIHKVHPIISFIPICHIHNILCPSVIDNISVFLCAYDKTFMIFQKIFIIFISVKAPVQRADTDFGKVCRQ